MRRLRTTVPAGPVIKLRIPVAQRRRCAGQGRSAGTGASQGKEGAALPRTFRLVNSSHPRQVKPFILRDFCPPLLPTCPLFPCLAVQRYGETGRAMGERTRSLLSLRSTMETHVLATMEACGAAYYASLAMLGSSMMKRVGLTTLGPRSWSN